MPSATRHCIIGLVASLVTALAVPALAASTAAAASAASDRGTGIGTAAALDGPSCDRSSGLVLIPPPFEVPCVRPFQPADDNGGATAPGVTATTIKVVIVTPAQQDVDLYHQVHGYAWPYNAASGSFGTWEDAARDMSAPFAHLLSGWGRKAEFETYQSTGHDEAAQRADALAIAQRHPFAVFMTSGDRVLETELANHKIVVFGGATNTEAAAQAPYRWGSASSDATAQAINEGEFVAKSLVGRKAQWAGDPAFRDETRRFGVVYPEPASRQDFDIADFNHTLARYKGGTVQLEIPYTDKNFATDWIAYTQEVAPTIITKLKQARVNNVILFTEVDLTREMLHAATLQNYRPEWTMSAFGSVDYNAFARGFDQSQWAHAFGIGGSLVAVDGAAQVTNLFDWYWGRGRATTSALLVGAMLLFYQGVHMAGPDLTAEHFRDGVFALPHIGGAAVGAVTTEEEAYGRIAGLPRAEYATVGLDATLEWWSPDAELPGGTWGFVTEPGTGNYYLVDAAKRYHAGTWPNGPVKFFDTSAAIVAVEHPTRADIEPRVACHGCPSKNS